MTNVINTTAAFQVTDVSQVAEARRAALLLAQRCGFPEARAGQVELVVSELATNLAKHARSGEMLFRRIGDERIPHDPVGIEILGIDSGPGMPDIALSRRDGHSTTGTLGQGLGAIARQSHVLEIDTRPSGTVAMARIWRDAQPGRVGQPLFEAGAVHVSKAGEAICGDDWACRIREDRVAVMIADGLGHGLAAHDAAHLAVQIFERSADESPLHIVTDLHAGLRSTRGAAVAVVVIDVARGTLRYSGLGNISSAIVTPSGERRSLVSQNGTAGHTAPRIQEFSYPMPPGSFLVMHSDGVGTHWDVAAHPGLSNRHPSVIAGVLYRAASRRRDDATVVILKERTPA